MKSSLSISLCNLLQKPALVLIKLTYIQLFIYPHKMILQYIEQFVSNIT